MYCKQETDEKKCEWTRQLRERRSCSSKFSTEYQGLDTEFRLKSSMKRMKSI